MVNHVKLETRGGAPLRVDADTDQRTETQRTRPDLISVILPVRGWPPLLEDQLQALAGQTWNGHWELLLVDNGGSAPVDDLVERWAPDLPIRIVAAREKEGINFARNRGIAESKGDLLAFCDADDIVDARWLEGLVAGALAADLVGGRLDEELLNGSTDGLRPRMPSDRLPVALEFLPFAVGANFAVWADVVVEMGPFDERYLIGNDDVEFSFRAQLLGFHLGYAPQAVVAYRHRACGREMFRQFRHYGRTEPLLYRSFRKWGMPRPTAWQVAKRWARIVVEVPLLLSRARRGAWLVRAGFSSGRLLGALRYRTPYL